MSTFTRAAVTSQQLSLIAMQEASRQGLREADLDHLLLALVISEQSAGLALRRLGITLPAARAAVEAQHAAQLATLGIGSTRPEPGPIVFHETSGYEWSKRAGDLLVRASSKKKRGDAAAVLRELLAEPSGLITQILQRLDTTPDAVRAALQETPDQTDNEPIVPDRAASRAASRIATTAAVTSFVPASPDRIWALINDPLRMAEWHPAIGRVDAAPLTGMAESWMGYARTTRPDGMPIRVRPRYVRRQIHRLTADEPRSITWRMIMPDLVRAPSRDLTIVLSASEGGTTLRLTEITPRGRGWRRVVGAPLAPARGFLAWLTLFHTGGGISRAFLG